MKGTLCPAARLRGRFRPLTVKPAPVIEAWEILVVVPPELVRVPDCVWLLPNDTVPKLILEEFALSCAAAGVVAEGELPALLGVGPVLLIRPMQPTVPITLAKIGAHKRRLHAEPGSFTF